MKARAGVTLIEVLIAIFIMAIGLLALMTLFPLGALSMALGMKDQRVSEAGQQANGIAIAHSIRTDPNVMTAFALGTLPAGWDGPSYPVFVDPWGFQIPTAPTLGGVVQRSNLSFITTRSLTERWCGLQDELSFQPNGVPQVLATGSIDRNPLTTWGYWLKRPNQTNPNVVEMSIVVYSGRNLLLPPTETLLTNSEYSTANPTQIQVPTGTDVRRGQWIVDLTTNNPASKHATTLANAKTYGPVQGYWYRVVEAVNTTTGIVLEVQPTPVVALKSLMVMDGVADVFPKGTGWK